MLTKAIIFDCDGVMFETRKINAEYYNCLLTAFNLDKMTDEQIDYMQMHTVSEAINYLFKDRIPLKDVYNEKKKQDSKKIALIKEMPIEPYLIEILEYLKKLKIKTAIATNRSDTMPFVLKEHKLNNLFDMVVTADNVQNPKPAPDCLLKILSEFKINSKEAFFIGDSTLDEISSNAANVPFIAFNNKNLNGKYHISKLNELKSILF